jgi:O-antigen/teichoic acid export membrane protein
MSLAAETVSTAAPGQAAVSARLAGASFVTQAGWLAGGNLMASGLRMAAGFLTAKAVEPAVLGLFNSMGLVQGYLPWLTLGVMNGVNRELPYYYGRGDQARMRELAAAGQAWAFLLATVTASGLMGIAAWQAAQGRWELAAGWVAQAISVWVLFAGGLYLQATFRTTGDFQRLALVNVVVNALNLVLVIAVWAFSFYGLCLRALAIALVQLALLWFWRPIKVASRWQSASLGHLLRVGAPIMLVGQLYAWWMVLDATLVLQYVGTAGLGLYALVVMAASTLQILPDAVGQVIYPRMALQYGRTGRMRDLVRSSLRPVLWLTLGMVVLTVLGWVLAPPLVRALLPKYTGATVAIQWGLLTPALLALSPLNNIFNVIKRQDLYLVAMVVGMLSYYGGVRYLMARGLELAVFPQAMAGGRLVFLVVAFALLGWLVRKERQAGAG